jgi:hypothetical protein
MIGSDVIGKKVYYIVLNKSCVKGSKINKKTRVRKNIVDERVRKNW